MTTSFQLDGDYASGLPPVCVNCLYYNAEKVFHCAAFPKERIPLPIWLGENDHTTPYPGDGGVRFTPLPSLK